MTEINGLKSCSLKEMISCVPYIWKIKKAPMVWGPPGIGKTAVIHSLAESMSYTIRENNVLSNLSERLSNVYGNTFTGRVVHPVRLIICSPTDMKGIPVFDVENKEAIWVMTGLFPVDPNMLEKMERDLVSLYESGEVDRAMDLEVRVEKALHDQYSILFMDEITQAPPSVQHAALQIILDKSSGTYHLPDTVDVICAGNRAGDRAGSHTMSSVLASRVVHFNIDEPDPEEFIEMAVSNGYNYLAISYIKSFPDQLYTFEPGSFTGSTFSCPRTWEMTSSLLNVCKDDKILNLSIPGILGDAGWSFLGWLSIANSLPPVSDYLSGEVSLEDVVSHFYEDGNYRVDLEFAFTLGCISEFEKGNRDPEAIDRFFSLLSRSSDTIDLAISSIVNLFSRFENKDKLSFVTHKSWKGFAKHVNVDGVFV